MTGVSRGVLLADRAGASVARALKTHFDPYLSNCAPAAHTILCVCLRQPRFSRILKR